MFRHVTACAAIFLFAAVSAASCGGRTLNGDLVPADDDGSGASGGSPGVGGNVGVGGFGGSGGEDPAGTGGEGVGGEGEGAGIPNPIDCITCVASNCPEAASCLTDPACLQGLGCAATQCLGGGEPDLVCVAGCFDGDFEKALEALQVIGCIFGSCGDECGGLLPFP